MLCATAGLAVSPECIEVTEGEALRLKQSFHTIDDSGARGSHRNAELANTDRTTVSTSLQTAEVDT